MQYLLSTSAVDLAWFDDEWQALERFLERHDLDGIEVFLPSLSAQQFRGMPPSLARGMHCSYWFNPWLKHWRRGERSHPSCVTMIDTLRRELDEAERLQVDYVVIHAGYADYAEALTHCYRHPDALVLETIAEVANMLFAAREPRFEVLFENIPVPGLKMTDPLLVPYLLDRVEHPRKGLMVDTGHIMNLNLALRDEAQAIQHVSGLVEALGEWRQSLRGLHLQRSLSWQFAVGERRRELVAQYLSAGSDEERGRISWEITLSTDQHRAFESAAVRGLVDLASPERVVFEFIPRSKEDLVQLVESQNRALGRAEQQEATTLVRSTCR